MSSFTAVSAADAAAKSVNINGCCGPQPLTEAYNLVEEVYVNRDQCHTELQVLDESPEDGIVVAVDVGTTYTGYAYSFRRSGRISVMKKPDCNYAKTPLGGGGGQCLWCCAYERIGFRIPRDNV